MNAEQIKDQILRRLNRGDEITDEDVYGWMNWAKREAQNGSPLRFMKHEAIVLLGSGLVKPGFGSATPEVSYHVRATLYTPSSAPHDGDSLAAVYLTSPLISNVVTRGFSAGPIFEHAGAATNFTYNAGNIPSGVSVSGSPSLTWSGSQFQVAYTPWSWGGNEFSQVWVGQEYGPASNAQVFSQVYNPDPSHLAFPSSTSNPCALPEVNGTTIDFHLWLVEFDVTFAASGGEIPEWPFKLRLPNNFHSPIRMYALTARTFTDPELSALFGDAEAFPFWYWPSSASTEDGHTDGHDPDSESKLYPLFTANREFLAAELELRGISYDFDAAMAPDSLVDLVLVNLDGFQAVQPAPRGASPIMATIGSEPSEELLVDLIDVVSAIGYEQEPFDGTILDASELVTVRGMTAPVLVWMVYWRYLPDYDAPNPEMVGGPIVSQDVFTESAARLLTMGALAEAYFFLEDDARAKRYRDAYDQEVAKFRLAWMATNHAANPVDRRLPPGTRVRRWGSRS